MYRYYFLFLVFLSCVKTESEMNKTTISTPFKLTFSGCISSTLLFV